MELKEPYALQDEQLQWSLSYMRRYFYYEQVYLDGLTGPVQFNEYGRRREIELEVLNLRNNSFERVSRKKPCTVLEKCKTSCIYVMYCTYVCLQIWLIHLISYFMFAFANNHLIIDAPLNWINKPL